eukprot:2024934-Rhodomonas_salina.1
MVQHAASGGKDLLATHEDVDLYPIVEELLQEQRKNVPDSGIQLRNNVQRCPIPTALRICYAASATAVACCRTRGVWDAWCSLCCAVLGYRMFLHVLCGTEIAYDATRCAIAYDPGSPFILRGDAVKLRQ